MGGEWSKGSGIIRGQNRGTRWNTITRMLMVTLMLMFMLTLMLMLNGSGKGRATKGMDRPQPVKEGSRVQDEPLAVPEIGSNGGPASSPAHMSIRHGTSHGRGACMGAHRWAEGDGRKWTRSTRRSAGTLTATATVTSTALPMLILILDLM